MNVTQSPINYVHHHRSNHFYYRNEIISHLDTNYHLLSHICQNMENYIRKVRQVLESKYIYMYFCRCRHFLLPVYIIMST